jgi:tetratricopeptide (TPR) repeat protein
MQAGVEAHKQGHLDVAIAEFRKATESDPSSAQAFLNLGETCVEMTDYTEAIPHLERVHAIEALGIAQIETGQYQDAIANLNAALLKRPGNPDLLYYLGRASGLLSKNAIDTLLGAYPDSARAHQAMGENYFVLRQMPQAEKEYQEALRLRPDIPGLHLELGLVYAGASQWNKAEQEFRAETKVQPGNAEAAYRLGASLLQEGKAHEARQELESAESLKPGMPETLYSLGKAASLDGDAAGAEKAWTKLVEIEKESSLAAQAHFGLAGLYRKRGKAGQAQHEMQEFQRLQGKIAPTREDSRPN